MTLSRATGSPIRGQLDCCSVAQQAFSKWPWAPGSSRSLGLQQLQSRTWKCHEAVYIFMKSYYVDTTMRFAIRSAMFHRYNVDLFQQKIVIHHKYTHTRYRTRV